ncbi:MAG: hypothetical protein JNL54_22310 [Kineosporiaceae bacterium]|nr:hypothetical protein [Kineosporiaceae bacterium]
MTETMTSPLPSRHAVRSLLEGLIGRDIEIKDGNPVPPQASNVLAVYVTDKLAVSALAVVDLAGGARLGGALAMMPKGGVDDAIAAKEMYPALRDNCYEVLNVLAAVFNVPNAPHVRLYEMLGPNGAVPGDIAALSATVGNRMDVQITVAGYGPGLLSLICR